MDGYRLNGSAAIPVQFGVDGSEYINLGEIYIKKKSDEGS